MMRQKIIIGNWKMNLDHFGAMKLVTEISSILKDEVNGLNVSVVIAPPFVHLYSAAQLLKTSLIKVAAQNCSDKTSGAYTAEVSAAMLASVGVQHVIIGHSERRMYFHEDDKMLSEKVNRVLENNMIPVFCCGENLEQRNARKHFDIVKQQLSAIFALEENNFNKCVIAYEPVWAIGTGITATPAQAQEMHQFIRNEIATRYSKKVAGESVLLYGGSVTAANAASLFLCDDVDGALVGGASLKAREFVEIIKAANT